MISGFQIAQAIHVAAELGLADLLAAGPQSAADLAAASGAHLPSLERLLRVLVAVGILRPVDDGFALTPSGSQLRRDVPGSLHADALFSGREAYRAFGELLHTVRTGETAFDHVYGAPLFDYFAQHPAAGEVYNEAFGRIWDRPTDVSRVVEAAHLDGVELLVDVGGGLGAMIAGALQRHPSMRGILFDLPSVVDQARPRLEQWGLLNRCQVVGGDFLQSVPGGGDAYLLSSIINEWDDDRALIILQNCRRAVTPAGRLLLAERVVPSGTGPSDVWLADLTMLGLTGGRLRTAGEFRALLAAAGFRAARATLTGWGAHHYIIEGTPS
jgi:SAM-dependent methyltransferase